MNNEILLSLKRNIEAIGRLLWEKNLVSGLNGNISTRFNDTSVLITATKTCLGLLQENDIVQINFQGAVIGEGQASSERFLHTAIYKEFPEVSAVLHTHTTYTNAYFLENDFFTPRIFESKFYLGQVVAIAQTTPNVTDLAPVMEALKSNSIVVLKNHGVVAMGKDLFDCFLLIQCLEDAVKIDAISRLYQFSKGKTTSKKSELSKISSATPFSEQELNTSPGSAKVVTRAKKFKFFSPAHINEIVRLINSDVQMSDLGKKTAMDMVLAIKLNETDELYCFHFQDGQIIEVDTDASAEFLIAASEAVWRAVFNRVLDPFVATTQKKMQLRGDFAKISKWYAPCSRMFEIWAQVPIE